MNKKKVATLAVVVCLGAFGAYMVYHEAEQGICADYLFTT